MGVPTPPERVSRPRAVMRWRLLAVLAILTIGVVPNRAQGPERQHAVRVPGTDSVLETGWKLVLAADRRCVYMVPASWPVWRDGLQTASPDGTASLHLTATHVASWSAYRAVARSAMQPTSVHEDTFGRLWLERIDRQWLWQQAAASDGANVCRADIEAPFRERGAAVVRKIGSSVRVASEGYKQWTKR